MSDHDILRSLKASEDLKVKVAVTDMDGILRGKLMHRDKCLSALKSGFGFCNVVFGWDCNDLCYENSAYTGWHSGYPDAQVALDPSTYRHIPWEKQTPFLLGDFVTENHEPLAVCPRNVLKKALAELNALGFELKAGFEFEWFNFQETPDSLQAKGYLNPKPLTPGMFGYSLLRSGQKSEYFHDLMDLLGQFRVPLEGLHTETGPGVYEAAISTATGLEACDRAVLLKAGVRDIASRHGIMASFMARWNQSLPGCSGHIHQSLLKDGQPVFFDPKDPWQMSSEFKHYLAGILELLPDMLTFFAPTVNSYKRLVEGFWAPTRATWGLDNRTVAMRVISGGVKSTRLEARVGGADLNPYLALAACIKAGTYGLTHKLPLKLDPIQGNGYADQMGKKLPSNLFEATKRMMASQTLHEIFGEEFIQHFGRSREWEWEQFMGAVTDWETRRYFEII